ncbi:hypothetical protein WA158_005010 [Blastocystis sp. Blastoise]
MEEILEPSITEQQETLEQSLERKLKESETKYETLKSSMRRQLDELSSENLELKKQLEEAYETIAVYKATYDPVETNKCDSSNIVDDVSICDSVPFQELRHTFTYSEGLKSNLLSCLLIPEEPQLILVSDALKNLYLIDQNTNSCLSTLSFSAPCISMISSRHDHIILCGCMDGYIRLVQIKKENSQELCLLDEYKYHVKYIYKVVESEYHNLYACASYDNTVSLFKFGENNKLELIKSFYFQHLPQSLGFIYNPSLYNNEEKYLNISDKNNKETYPELVIYETESTFLYYINCVTYEHEKISINDHEWDSHHSFNILDIYIN